MIESLEQLKDYVQRLVPEPRALAALKTHDRSDYVSFEWHSTQFVIKKTLQVFEVKGHALLVSGSSMLMQDAFLKAEVNERVITAIIDSMRQAQTLVASGEDIALGLKVLSNVKFTLRKLTGMKPAAREITTAASLVGTVSCVPA